MHNARPLSRLHTLLSRDCQKHVPIPCKQRSGAYGLPPDNPLLSSITINRASPISHPGCKWLLSVLCSLSGAGVDGSVSNGKTSQCSKRPAILITLKRFRTWQRFPTSLQCLCKSAKFLRRSRHHTDSARSRLTNELNGQIPSGGVCSRPNQDLFPHR